MLAEGWSTTAPSLLGREDEIAGVIEALEPSRLVTLSGAPGIGKTTLAREVADRYPTGAVFAELAPVTDPGRVLGTLANAVGLPELSGEDPIEALAAALRRRRLLLVVDNCEHLLDSTSRALAQLLAACPDLRVLASSREALGLAEEREWQVLPLSVPPPDADTDTEALLGYPAVALFVARARDAQPGFELNSFLAPDVAEICRRLDGVPLAIELAAARVAALAPSEIVLRLADRLSLLSDGGRSSISRHRTLAAALDWSHALLTAPERALLRRLSVFAGRFELEAAEAVCGGEQVDPPGVATLLGRVVAKSLVASKPSGRYHLLETIRAYAAGKLEQAGEGADVRTAHARYCLDLAERAEPELTGADQQLWLDRLDELRPDLRSAVVWSLSSGKVDRALRIVGALTLFWRVRGRFTEGRDLLATALAASSGASVLLRARARWGVGFLTLMTGDWKRAISHLEQSLDESRAADDVGGAARALLVLANARQVEHDPVVPTLLEESISLARQVGDSWCLAHALGVAGFECVKHGDPRRGRRMFEECVAVARAANDFQGLRYGLIGLGEAELCQGGYRHAHSLLEEAVELTRALGEAYDHAVALALLGQLAGDRGEYADAEALLYESEAALPQAAPKGATVTNVLLLARAAHAQGDRRRARRLLDEIETDEPQPTLLLAYANLARGEGHLDQARVLLEEAREVAHSQGRRGLLAAALHGLGQVARDAGDPEPALALQDDALDLLYRTGATPKIADALEAIAGLAVEAGHHRHAARMFAAAGALRDRIGYARPPWDQTRYDADVAMVSRRLSPAEREAAEGEGRRLSLADAVREASSAPLTRRAKGWATLTGREREIAELIAQRLTTREIADRLVIAPGTVKVHVRSVFAKLGINERRELARELRYRNGPR